MAENSRVIMVGIRINMMAVKLLEFGLLCRIIVHNNPQVEHGTARHVVTSLVLLMAPRARHVVMSLVLLDLNMAPRASCGYKLGSSRFEHCTVSIVNRVIVADY